MPNWCANAVEITGPTDAIDTLWQDAHREEKGLLSAMAPLDEWDYQDAISTWGTKWDVDIDDTSLSLHNRDEFSTITGHFDTAWGPPTTAFNTWLADNPDCEAELLFYEGGNDFCGTLGTGEFTISDTGVSFFEQDPVGIQLDQTFGIVDMLHEYEDEVQDQILKEPLTLQDPEEIQ